MNRLAALLRRLQGAVIVSSYPGALYERLYADWYRLEWTGGQLCSQNTGERKRTECVWLNDKARQLSPIRRLF